MMQHSGSQRVVVVVPLPDRVLSTNGPQGNFMAKAQARRDARTTARYAAMAALPPGHVAWGRCVATVRFFYPDRRRRDTSNSFASLKGALDGITDAQVWADDQHIEWHIPPAAVDRGNPRVEVEIHEGAERWQ